MPVSGETMPPTRNAEQPMSAEALPELARSNSSASDVEVGSTSPRQKSSAKSAASTHQTGASVTSARAANRQTARKPRAPASSAAAGRRKRVTAKLPSMMAKALTPKSML